MEEDASNDELNHPLLVQEIEARQEVQEIKVRQGQEEGGGCARTAVVPYNERNNISVKSSIQYNTPSHTFIVHETCEGTILVMGGSPNERNDSWLTLDASCAAMNLPLDWHIRSTLLLPPLRHLSGPLLH